MNTSSTEETDWVLIKVVVASWGVAYWLIGYRLVTRWAGSRRTHGFMDITKVSGPILIQFSPLGDRR